MKKLVTFIFTLLISTSALANEAHVGVITADELLSGYQKFENHLDDLSYDENDIQRIRDIKTPVHIKVFFGTWCHDSQREVPRLIKLLEEADNSQISLWLYGLDLDKQDPEGLADKHNVKYTPTIIFEVKGSETLRSIERPEENWVDDIINASKT